ncbi:MAG: DUF116 domain-containing protein [Elusimicrobia bacterium]|nr:DUF116 domain-containing protein [Elusimicrobiota bacterium]
MKLCVINKKTNQEKNKILTEKKNLDMEKLFSAIPYEERIAFVPHCLRNSEKCKAKERGSYFICMECGACKISKISKKAKELGYKGIFILKGGRTIEKLVKEFKPKAVLGVACYFEGAQGIELLDNNGGKDKIAVQFVPLTKDGCTDTDVNLDVVLKALSK